MMTPTSGPDVVDWAGGLLRGLHPVRWLLCLVGLLVSAALVGAAQLPFGQAEWDLLPPWQQPVEQAAAV
jgi:hypothetical protein